MTVLDRFLKYVKIYTESEEDIDAVPSTAGQWDLAKLLCEELKEIGAQNVRLSEKCYVYAEIPATGEWATKEHKTLGFIAHMDTSCAVSGKDVKPQIISNYNGGAIMLNQELNISMSPEQFPELLRCKGQDLVVADGTTLLGADDKAGVAEIMAMAEYLLSHPEISHKKILIGFTPDEEVGRGADFFDVEGFGADYAYTVDGGEIGEIEYENFNAASAKIVINGVSVHPGTAKDKMKNALLLGMELQNMLPPCEVPEHTEGYEGFYHLTDMSGGVEKASMHYIIRDHSAEKFEDKKKYFSSVVEYLNNKYGEGTFIAEVKDSYRNMREIIEENMHLITNLEAAMRECDIVPKIIPIRGGTDGARLSYMGLPCPNICTGGFNFHGKYEFIPVQSMEKITKLLICLALK